MDSRDLTLAQLNALFAKLAPMAHYLRKLENGLVIEVPMASLSIGDRIWIRRLSATDKAKKKAR